MRRTLLVIGLMVVGVAVAAAVDIALRDGSVIHATSYQVTGSYLTVVLADGRQVAYSTSDVDLDALRAQEALVAEPPPATQPPGGIATALAQLGAPSSVTISDGDVEHVGGVGEEEKPAASGPPPGYREGGQVGLQAARLNQVEPGVWEATGEVVNQTGRTVGDVHVQLEVYSDVGGMLASADVPVTSQLEPTIKASFSHRFTFTSEKPPRLRGRVYWLEEEAAAQAAPPPPGPTGQAPAATDGGSARPTPIS